ncbi:MAG: hypothetical protein LBU32_23860 [Clostridiales bacterium]|jgi:hypothetical protein|nr:hypothetical protein [Clostridiales bacterium]
MAEMNFFDSGDKTPEKKGLSKAVLIIALIIAVLGAGFFTLRKTFEAADLAKQKTEMKSFVESSDTLAQLAEYNETAAKISEIENVKIPMAKAYVNYKILNTATAALIDNYIWAPIKADPGNLEFTELSVAGDVVSVNASIKDVSAMSKYMAQLRVMKARVDKDGIDKPIGAPVVTTDDSIPKFKWEFTYEISKQSDSVSNKPFKGTLSLFINKDITDGMFQMLGGK